jgi:regulator of replication initiation timing
MSSAQGKTAAPKKGGQSGPGGGLGTPLLPSKGPNKASVPVIHRQGGKRTRVETSSPQKEVSGTNWHVRIEEDVNWIKGKIGTAALGIKTDKITSLANSFQEFMSNTLVEIFERQANTASDMSSEINMLVDENNRLRAKLNEQGEELEQVKIGRERVEVKASKKEMEDKVRIAASQFKVLNLDLGKQTEDRKEILGLAKEALCGKVRADLRTSYDEKIRTASLKVLSGKTFKTSCEGKEFWTAPILVTVQDRDTRWELENVLRKSKVFPGFHWPREMVDNIKRYRQVVKDLGYSDSTHYVRIRPEERDGSWRIRADAKAKDSDSRFVNIATFAIPPLDENLKSFCAGWEKPVWQKPGVSKPASADAEAADATGEREQGHQEDEDEITAEDIVMHY